MAAPRFFAGIQCFLFACLFGGFIPVWAVMPESGFASFSESMEVPVGQGPRQVRMGDVNEDGSVDLVSVNSTTGSLSIALGKGNGTFMDAFSLAVDPWPMDALIRDLNGDGHEDIVTGGSSGDRLEIRFGKGNASFSDPEYFNVDSGSYSFSAGDLNGDGKMDLVSASFDADKLSLLLSTNTASSEKYVRGESIPTGNGPHWVCVGDFNRDGKVDLANVNFYESSISVRLGNGDGTFGNAVDYGVGRRQPTFPWGDHSRPAHIQVFDYNEDGILDISVANSQWDTISILFGEADGAFKSAEELYVGRLPSCTVSADFNGDRKIDLVSSDSGQYTLTFLLGDGKGHVELPHQLNLSSSDGSLLYPFGIETADLNHDGRPDIVVSFYFRDKIGVFLNTSAPKLAVKLVDRSLQVLWPAWKGFRLEHAVSMPTNNWTAVLTAPNEVGNEFLVEIPISSDQQFFRLVQN